MTTITERIEERKEAIKTCLKQYSYLKENPALIDEVIAFEGCPRKPCKKLAFLILTYKREATVQELKTISDQPAGMVRSLRKDGFLFQDNGKKPPGYYYTNATGETCRRIVGYQFPEVKLSGRVRAILEKSVAACISAIEVYNKPDFRYREETFSILLVNAWELLLKAEVLSLDNNKIRSIQEVNKNGFVVLNHSGNPRTIDIHKAIDRLVAKKLIDDHCRQNIEFLIEIRDNAVHYINKSSQFSKRVQEIGTAGLKNYITAVTEWFDVDLTQYNFFLMPMSFFHPTEADSFSVRGHDKEIQRLLDYFRREEDNFLPDEDNPYSLALEIKTSFVKSSAHGSALKMQYGNGEDILTVKVSEEDVIRAKYPLTYKALIGKIRNRYSDFKQDGRFYGIKRDLEDSSQHGQRYCKVRYLDSESKRGPSKIFYSTEILKELDRHYTRIKK